MAAAAVLLVEGAASTSPNRTMAVSKHLPSFLPSIISPAPSLYYNFPYSLLLFFPLDLKGITAHLSLSFLFSFPFSFITTTTTTTTTTTMGLSDHCLTLSGWGMTIAALGLAVLGPFWSSFLFWVVRWIKRVCRSLFVNTFDYYY